VILYTQETKDDVSIKLDLGEHRVPEVSRAKARRAPALMLERHPSVAQYATEAELLETTSNKPNQNRWKRNPNHNLLFLGTLEKGNLLKSQI
jgi:hypothetical protein